MQTNSDATAVLRTTGSRTGNLLARGGQQLIITALIVLLAVAIYSIKPSFLSPRGIGNILLMTSMYGIAALGMMLVIITGGIDLSVGSMIALGGALGAGLLGTAYGAANPLQFPAPVAILLALAVTGGIGVLNGVAVTVFNIAPFVVTLGMMTVVRGLTFIFADYTVGTVSGSPITFSDPWFDWLGAGTIGPLPVATVLFLVLSVAVALTLRFTPFGRAVYAIGGDIEIARLAGVDTRKVMIAVYALVAMLSGLSGIILTGRLSSVSPLMGTGYELNIITIVVVGGASLAGGRGTVLGTMLAALLITMIDNGLNMLNVPSFYQYLVKGAVLLIAVTVDKWHRERTAS
jgi:ribose/xylose/arabinose/galactoside ABC-type transport system permease subunit